MPSKSIKKCRWAGIHGWCWVGFKTAKAAGTAVIQRLRLRHSVSAPYTALSVSTYPIGLNFHGISLSCSQHTEHGLHAVCIKLARWLCAICTRPSSSCHFWLIKHCRRRLYWLKALQFWQAMMNRARQVTSTTLWTHAEQQHQLWQQAHRHFPAVAQSVALGHRQALEAREWRLAPDWHFYWWLDKSWRYKLEPKGCHQALPGVRWLN